MRDWARQELNGYDDPDSVPRYRHLHAVVMAVITNLAGYKGVATRIHEDVFPREIRGTIRETFGDMEEVILPHGIGWLEDLASQGTEMHRLSPPFSSIMAGTLNQFHVVDPNSRVAEVYWSVPNAALRDVLVRIRTALTDLVSELIIRTPDGQELPDKQAADQAFQLTITGDGTTVHVSGNRAGDTVTHNSGSQYNFGDVTGSNLAAGSSNFTQNYTAGADIAAVREFTDIVAGIADGLDLGPRQQTELSAATAELDQAISDPAPDKQRLRRAVQAVLGYLKEATSTALTRAAINAGNLAVTELDTAIHHVHP
jgi:hypothetical protein